jgi:hypothetical protein
MAKWKPPRASSGEVVINDGTGSCKIDELPTFCPRCQRNAIPKPLGNGARSTHPDEWMFPTLDVPVRCTNCDLVYIAEYEGEPIQAGPDLGDVEIVFHFTRTVPNAMQGRPVSGTLQKISPRFSQVFDQAAAAENDGLTEIAGGGYRRALEILVKDYLSYKEPTSRDTYVRTWLGECITKHIADPTIQDLAKRANIIANDFVHYESYGANELSDLVSLIDLTRAWIELQAETETVRANLDSPRKTQR